MASISQSGSLSLFSSKDLELEQRALLLKRLAFVIFCSDMDQYQKQMPEIQGEIVKKSYFYYYYNFPIFSIDSFFFLFFFSKPCLLFISWNRTLGRKFEDNSYISSCTICCFPLFSSHLDSNVSSTCHIPLAIDHHRNGSNIFLLRTGTFN